MHTDEGAVLYLAGMQQRHVADGDVAADRGHQAARRDMHDRAVLEVGVLADADARTVTAQDDAEPDAGVGSDLDVADQGRIRRDERRARDLGNEAFEDRKSTRLNS